MKRLNAAAGVVANENWSWGALSGIGGDKLGDDDRIEAVADMAT